MDGIQFALEMEIEGEPYYRRQSEKFTETPLHTVFDLLAKDESKHASILRGKMENTTYASSRMQSFPTVKPCLAG